MQAVKQNRSELTATFSQVTSRPDATSSTDMLSLFMALPFLVESTPQAYGLKAGDADQWTHVPSATTEHQDNARLSCVAFAKSDNPAISWSGNRSPLGS